MGGLFQNRREPLAAALRPKSLDEIVGQGHLLGKGAKLRKLIESDTLASILLFGPAGTGKTTIAAVIALTTKAEFVKLNATQATVKDIRKHGENAKKLNSRVVVFTDEVHRFSKVQQDILLPYVEDGHIIFIGATTENPFFSISTALLSRCQMVCELEPLKPADLVRLLLRGVEHLKKTRNIKLDKEAAQHIITVANGDGRKVISILEVAAAVADEGDLHITLELAKAVSPSKYMVFGDQAHFDLASWTQGAIQASDPDSAIYALSKWLESGEDPRYIARRIMVSASEDAMSTPEAAMVAHNAYIAACEIGRPECDIILAHAVVLIASAKRDKSAAKAIWAAVKDVRDAPAIEIPKPLKDSHYPGAAKLGHGAYHDGMAQSEYVGIDRIYYRPPSWSKYKNRNLENADEPGSVEEDV